MNWQFKKIFSVIFALLIGAGIIFFAWKGGTVIYTGDSSSVNNTTWKEVLSVIPQNDTLKLLSSSQDGSEAGEATTTVDIVARNLLTNYALVQKNNMSTTTLSDADAIAIAQIAVSKINLPEARQFTVKDLNISSDNSSTALDTYMKEIGSLVQVFTLSQTKNDIEVAFVIPKTGNETKRATGVAQNIAHYEKLIKGLLATKTPSLLTQPHLHLVQKYANIQATILPMAGIFTDPIKGLAALSEYRGEVAGFSILANEYSNLLSKNQ